MVLIVQLAKTYTTIDNQPVAGMVVEEEEEQAVLKVCSVVEVWL